MVHSGSFSATIPGIALLLPSLWERTVLLMRMNIFKVKKMVTTNGGYLHYNYDKITNSYRSSFLSTKSKYRRTLGSIFKLKGHYAGDSYRTRAGWLRCIATRKPI